MSNNEHILRLIKTVIDRIQPTPGKEQVFYRDELLKGFALRVTASGVKSFVVETRIDGRVRRITLGKYGNLTAEEARKEAKSLLGCIAHGDNPIAEKKAIKIKGMTLKQVFDDYLKARKELKPTTAVDYGRALNQVVPDWLDKPIISINREMIAKRHAQRVKRKAKQGLITRCGCCELFSILQCMSIKPMKASRSYQLTRLSIFLILGDGTELIADKR